MSWIMRDFECACGHEWEEMLDSREPQESPCPECKTVCDKVAITVVPCMAYSIMDPEAKKEHLLQRSAKHTLKEIQREPEKHGDIGKQMARASQIRSK